MGWGQLVANCSVISYYTCLIALAVFYLTASFSTVLPWMVCNAEYTPPNKTCVASGGFGNDSVVTGDDGEKIDVIGAAEQYFK